jgi:hypothetical protein
MYIVSIYGYKDHLKTALITLKRTQDHLKQFGFFNYSDIKLHGNFKTISYGAPYFSLL